MPKCPKCNFQWISTSRSEKQNNYYFGVVVDMLSNETGNELEETHELLKLRFLKPMGKKSTTELTTVEFNAFIERIQRWSAQELGCVIPDPNEVKT